MSKAVKRASARLGRVVSNTYKQERKLGSRGEAFSGRTGLGWNRKTTREEILAQSPRLFMSYGITIQDLDIIKKTMGEAELKRLQDRKQQQEAFAAKQATEMMPESYIPRIWMVRFAYPKKLAEIETRYTLKDLEHVRNLALAGQLNHINHPDNMAAFLTWLNATIEKKRGNN